VFEEVEDAGERIGMGAVVICGVRCGCGCDDSCCPESERGAMGTPPEGVDPAELARPGRVSFSSLIVERVRINESVRVKLCTTPLLFTYQRESGWPALNLSASYFGRCCLKCKKGIGRVSCRVGPDEVQIRFCAQIQKRACKAQYGKRR